MALCVVAAILPGAVEAADDAWQYGEAPIVGGGGRSPQLSYVGPRDRGFELAVECSGRGPSVYITVNDPGPDLRQLRFDTPIPVIVRLQRPGAPAQEARVTASLSEGYIANTNRIRVGIGLQDGAAVAGLLGRDPGPGKDPGRAVIEIGRTSASFVMTGAHAAFAQFERRCPAARR
jgi:hypothetical protein